MLAKFPINYVGGKYRILPRLLSEFPPCRNFYDIFCGGFTVGINAVAAKTIGIDIIPQLINMFNFWQSTPNIVQLIEETIAEKNLSKHNAEAYYKLRKDYNESPNDLYFCLLIMHSFNYQIRFNNSSHFNMPFGKNRSSYNPKMKKNLISFLEKLDGKEFVVGDYQLANPEPEDFVYCDPPYRISTAVYNSGWTVEDDIRLTNWLDELSAKKIKFALSNVLSHKNESNEIISNWSQKYNVINLQIDYNNCNYHKKTKGKSEEVLIKNY